MVGCCRVGECVVGSVVVYGGVVGAVVADGSGEAAVCGNVVNTDILSVGVVRSDSCGFEDSVFEFAGVGDGEVAAFEVPGDGVAVCGVYGVGGEVGAVGEGVYLVDVGLEPGGVVAGDEDDSVVVVEEAGGYTVAH